MKLVETDPDSDSEIYQLTEDSRPTDNIYGEQPYGNADGNRITVRHYSTDETEGGLSFLDLEDGSLHVVISGQPRFPAFHAWGDYLYYQQEKNGELLLKRCHYQNIVHENVIRLPDDVGNLSYGTTSQDGNYYAVSVRQEDGLSLVLLFHISDGQRETMVQSMERYFKHEQFSLDATNRVLIQANSLDVSSVYLGILNVGKEGVAWTAADRPHTPRPTGHEAWIGSSDRIFYSTGFDNEGDPNLWITGVNDQTSTPVTSSSLRGSHVSVSRCGNYWICDAAGEERVPIYIGSIKSGKFRKLVESKTVHDGKQWSHTHPYVTADNKWLIYTSTRAGHPQVFGARIPDSFLEEL